MSISEMKLRETISRGGLKGYEPGKRLVWKPQPNSPGGLWFKAEGSNGGVAFFPASAIVEIRSEIGWNGSRVLAIILEGQTKVPCVTSLVPCSFDDAMTWTLGTLEELSKEATNV